MYFPQQRASSFTEWPYLISCSNPHKNSAEHTRGSLRWLHKWSQSQGNSSCFPSFSEHRDSACSLLLSAILSCVILVPRRLTAELTINSLPLASPFFITSKNKYVGILLQCLLLITIEKQKITKLNIGSYHFTVVVSIVPDSLCEMVNWMHWLLPFSFILKGAVHQKFFPFLWRPLFSKHRPADKA